MKRVLTAIWIVFLVHTAHADEYHLTFVVSEHQRVMTPDELATVEAKVREFYPRAVERVVAYFQDESLRARLSTLNIVLSQNASNPYQGETFVWKFRGPDKEQSIFVGVQSVLLGRGSLEALVAHELTHVAQEYGQKYSGMAAAPDYLVESMAYEAGGDVTQVVLASLNGPDPVLKWGNPKQEEWLRRMAFERVYTQCFGQEYGEDARRKLVREFVSGTQWRTAIKRASGEETAKAARLRVGACRDRFVKSLFSKAERLKEARKADRADDAPRVIALTEQALADDPDNPWQVSIQWLRVDALAAVGRMDEKIQVLDDLRHQKFGENARDDTAAIAIVAALTGLNRCDEARDKRAEFVRFHGDIFKPENIRFLDQQFAENCNAATPLRFEARKLRYGGDVDGASAAYRSAIETARALPGREDWIRNVQKEYSGMVREAGRYDEALAMDRAMLADNRTNIPTRRSVIADTLVNVAKDQEGLRDWSGAETSLTEAIELYKAATGPDDKRLPAAEGFLGRVYQQAGRIEDARPYLESALAHAEARSKKNSTLIADAALDLAAFLKDQGDTTRSRELAERARDIYADAYPADDRRLVRATELAAAPAP